MSDLETLPGPALAHSPAGQPPGGVPPRIDGTDSCPLCGAPLHPQQEWCLRCGAAARTRLAATPNWRAPVAAIAAVIALSLGVLAAALVDLAGSSSPTRTQVTRTVTTAPAAAVPAPASTLPATTAAAPTATAPAGSVAPAPQAGASRTTTTPTRTTTTTRPAAPATGATGSGSIIPGVTQPGNLSSAPRK